MTEIIYKYQTFLKSTLKMTKKPENMGPPELYYNEDHSRKYTTNSRIIEIQSKMSERSIELLNLKYPNSNFILDIGCGSGISGEVISEKGDFWIGVDISEYMLKIAYEKEVKGDMIMCDIGNGLFFKNPLFDGCISISVLQWLCHANKKSENPIKRLEKFFSSLYTCLLPGARAVFQLYPDNPDQLEIITKISMKCGFHGGLIVDFPDSKKAKKMYLCLIAGISYEETPNFVSNNNLNEDKFSVVYSKNKNIRKSRNLKKRMNKKKKIILKKNKLRKRGHEMPNNSKYTGRRRNKFRF